MTTAYDLIRRCGPVPVPYVQQPNPAYEAWIERAAMVLCMEGHDGERVCMPCSDHLREARRIAREAGA